MPVQRLSCPSYTQPLQTPACCYRTAAVRCALPVKRTTERELQDMTGKVQGDNEQVKEGGQSQRQRRRQCGHQTSAPRSPSPPELPSFAQMRAELKEHGTANNPGVLLTSVRLLHDKLLTSFPSTSSLPASPQQPSWPQPGHAQNNEPPQDEKTTDRYVLGWASARLQSMLHSLMQAGASQPSSLLVLLTGLHLSCCVGGMHSQPSRYLHEASIHWCPPWVLYI